MVKEGKGSIVNIASIGGIYMNAGVSYSAAKAGVNGLTRNIALQYAGTGIRCNSVNPGPTPTEANTPEKTGRVRPGVHGHLRAAPVLGRASPRSSTRRTPSCTSRATSPGTSPASGWWWTEG